MSRFSLRSKLFAVGGGKNGAPDCNCSGVKCRNCSAPGVVADNGGPGGGGGGGGGPCCTVGVGPAFVGLVPVPG